MSHYYVESHPEHIADRCGQFEAILEAADDQNNAEARLSKVAMFSGRLRGLFTRAVDVAESTQKRMLSIEGKILASEKFIKRHEQNTMVTSRTIIENETTAIKFSEAERSELSRALRAQTDKVDTAARNHGVVYEKNAADYLTIAVADAQSHGYEPQLGIGTAQHAMKVVPVLNSDGEPVYSKLVGSIS